MKKRTIILGLVTIGFTAYSFSSREEVGCKIDKEGSTISFEEIAFNKEQELFYSVMGNYKRPISKNKLMNAQLISDVIENYPSNWIKNYRAVEITSIKNGKRTLEISSNENLTDKQKELFVAAEIGATFEIKVKYKTDNSVNKSMDNREMNVSVSLIPEVQAKFPEGHDKLIDYLKKECKGKLNLDKIAMKYQKDREGFFVDNMQVLFFINKNGKVENVRMQNSSKDLETDKTILKVISKMPKWIPAKNALNENVGQEFLFLVGTEGC